MRKKSKGMAGGGKMKSKGYMAGGKIKGNMARGSGAARPQPFRKDG